MSSFSLKQARRVSMRENHGKTGKRILDCFFVAVPVGLFCLGGSCSIRAAVSPVVFVLSTKVLEAIRKDDPSRKINNGYGNRPKL